MFCNDLWEHLCVINVHRVVEDSQDHPIMFGSMWFPVDPLDEQMSVPDLFGTE